MIKNRRISSVFNFDAEINNIFVIGCFEFLIEDVYD